MDWKEFVYGYKNGHTWQETADEAKRRYPTEFGADAYNKVRQYLRRRYKSERTNTISHLPLPSESPMYTISNEYKADGTFVSDKLITICEDTPITPDSILKAHGLQAGLWQVVSYKNNLWHSQNKSNERMVMYQSKLVAKPIVNGLDFNQIEQHFKTLDREYSSPKIISDVKTGLPCMAEVNIADLHLGKLCHRGNTGNNYDSKIAHELFDKLVVQIATEIKSKNIEKILFVWSNDFFNSDTIDRKTTAGTPQDTDSRFEKLFNVGVEMLVNAINVFSSIAPVETFYVASNHDKMASYYAIKYLEAWFKNDSRVSIDTNAMGRKYRNYGSTLIGFCHGCDINPKKLSGLMPIEARELWGKAKYCEMHTAHLHSEHAIEEINGIIVRRISSPTANDTWHVESGYIGQVRKAQTFIYDKEMGLLNIINSPVS